MPQTETNCPHCDAAIRVDTTSYLDCGDVCYDIDVEGEDAEELDYDEQSRLGIQLGYRCLSCQGIFTLKLDEKFWGDNSIPVYAYEVESEEEDEDYDLDDEDFDDEEDEPTITYAQLLLRFRKHDRISLKQLVDFIEDKFDVVLTQEEEED